MRELMEQQRKFYETGATKSIEFRKAMLRRLQGAIVKYEPALYQALKVDLNKSESEAYLTEIQMLHSEIKLALNQWSRWGKPRRVRTPLPLFPAVGDVYREPYGNVLILSPWNYPVQLTLIPLIGAIAGGNCAVVKTSRHSSVVSAVIKKMLDETFPPKYICCLSDECAYEIIFSEVYDLIFFTGSPRVGRIVMREASRHLTPVVLELGGKSPCIVEKTAHIKLAAKRIAWGKFLNAGQTCVAPDYVLVDETIKEAFLTELKLQITKMYGNALTNVDYPRIISRHHYDRLKGYVDGERKKWGGASDVSTCRIAPTLFCHASFTDPVMQEEIFGPILPIISYRDLNQVIHILKKREKPLACYVFSRDRQRIEQLLHTLSFGGGCVNDVMMHLANHRLPFGGVGNSGMGSYHGTSSLAAFTREKSIFTGKNFLDMPLRYPPYSAAKLKLLRRIMG